MQRERRGGLVVRWTSDQPLATLYVTSLPYAEILFGIHLQPEGKRRRHFAEQVATTFAEDFAGRVLSSASTWRRPLHTRPSPPRAGAPARL